MLCAGNFDIQGWVFGVPLIGNIEHSTLNTE